MTIATNYSVVFAHHPILEVLFFIHAYVFARAKDLDGEGPDINTPSIGNRGRI